MHIAETLLARPSSIYSDGRQDFSFSVSRALARRAVAVIFRGLLQAEIEGIRRRESRAGALIGSYHCLEGGQYIVSSRKVKLTSMAMPLRIRKNKSESVAGGSVPAGRLSTRRVYIDDDFDRNSSSRRSSLS